MSNRRKITSQLENRKHNLAVLKDVMEHDTHSAEKLTPVTDFLSTRIQSLERELAA